MLRGADAASTAAPLMTPDELKSQLLPVRRALALDGIELTERFARQELSAAEFADAFGQLVNRYANLELVPHNVGVFRTFLEELEQTDRAPVIPHIVVIPPQR